MKITFYFLLSVLLALQASAQTHVFSGGEFVTFGTLDLGSGTWSTDRSSSPGYFSAVGTGTYTGAIDAHNIDGYVKAYDQMFFDFPVGSGTDLRGLSISNPTGMGTYATAWIVGDPSGPLDPTDGMGASHDVNSVVGPIMAISPVGQWDWQNITGTGAGVVVTVSIPDVSTFATAANLRLVGWNGVAWIDLSGGPNATGNVVDSELMGTLVAGISALGIGSIEVPLPVELISFTASELSCKADLKWVTTAEIQLHHFEVEQSQDAVVFTKLGQVRSSQIEGSGNTYHFSTTQPPGTSYYRLKMVDQDYSFAYSHIQSLTTSCSKSERSLEVYPNPITAEHQHVTVDFVTNYKGIAALSVSNLLGQRLISQNILVDGSGTTSFGSSALSSGLYLVRLQDSQGKIITEIRKFVKE
ncbi:putative secreted protein (Por secretion system target) [Dyadobacter jejuensis]|uniref:Putative secreted protein (Por secretion system target) n=1 Tax=Dyadobacter jejuensis TaxID=1082580 RepID=A0A316B2Z1_9BACT|nr:T9SS type A sorting domain-containing protein [Dyadobacter jejuensis]PWJ56917.1 putative secreted protein (Por secretion system target) [Dyadobacter jejuensis]